MPLAIRIERALGRAFPETFGDRLVALAAYGSSVDDSAIPDFSDFDLAVFLHGGLSASDAAGVQRCLGDLDIRPFVYVQTKFVDVDARPQRSIVPGIFGSSGAPFRTSPTTSMTISHFAAPARSGCERYRDLVADDQAAWSVSAGSARRQRLVRLLMTRLKPTVRALLVERGEPPLAVWRATWSELASRWDKYEPEAGEVLASLLVALPPQNREAELDCGEAMLLFLERVVSETRSLDRLSRAAPMRASAMP